MCSTALGAVSERRPGGLIASSAGQQAGGRCWCWSRQRASGCDRPVGRGQRARVASGREPLLTYAGLGSARDDGRRAASTRRGVLEEQARTPHNQRSAASASVSRPALPLHALRTRTRRRALPASSAAVCAARGHCHPTLAGALGARDPSHSFDPPAARHSQVPRGTLKPRRSPVQASSSSTSSPTLPLRSSITTSPPARPLAPSRPAAAPSSTARPRPPVLPATSPHRALQPGVKALPPAPLRCEVSPHHRISDLSFLPPQAR